MIQLIREHPALFLGEEREDLERVWAEDEQGNRYNIKVISIDEKTQERKESIVREILTEYPHNLEFEIVENQEAL